MNKLFTKIAALSLGLTMAVGVGVAVATSNGSTNEVKAADLVASFDSSTVVTNSSYTQYSDDYWKLSMGGNNISAGWNKSNWKTIHNSGSNNEYDKYVDGTSVTTSHYAWVAASKSKLSNVGSMEFSISAGGNKYSSGKLYLTYSTDGSTFTLVTLTSGNQGTTTNDTNVKRSNKTTYSFDTISSAYFAVIVSYGTSSDTKNAFRFDDVQINYYAGSQGTTYTVTDSVDNGDLSSTASIAEGDPLDITLNPDNHYHLPTGSDTPISVTMGGNDVTSTAFNASTGAIYIESVTGNVVVSGACVEDAKYTVKYVKSEHGSGSDYTYPEQIYGGETHTLLTEIQLKAAGISADSGYKLGHYQIGQTSYNPGEQVAINANTTVTAVFSLLDPSLVLDKDTFVKSTSSTGYAGWDDADGSKRAPISGYSIASSNVMIQDSKVQFRRSPHGYLFNVNGFSQIDLIKLSGTNTTSSTKVEVSFSATTSGSAGTVGTRVSIGTDDYWIPTISNAKYFYIIDTSSSLTFTAKSVEVYGDVYAAKAFSNDFVTAMSDDDVCGTTSESWNRNNKTAVTTIWNSYGPVYAALTTDTKDDFKTNETEEIIVQARTLYLHCVARYELTPWTGGPTTAQRINTLSEAIDSNGVTIVVVIVSVASLTAIGGFFFLKKRREQN